MWPLPSCPLDAWIVLGLSFSTAVGACRPLAQPFHHICLSVSPATVCTVPQAASELDWHAHSITWCPARWLAVQTASIHTGSHLAWVSTVRTGVTCIGVACASHHHGLLPWCVQLLYAGMAAWSALLLNTLFLEYQASHRKSHDALAHMEQNGQDTGDGSPHQHQESAAKQQEPANLK